MVLWKQPNKVKTKSDFFVLFSFFEEKSPNNSFGWHTLALNSQPFQCSSPICFPEEPRAFVPQTSRDRFGWITCCPPPSTHTHLSWKSYTDSCVSMAEKEGSNNKAYQSVGHGREGRFHEDGSPSSVLQFTLSTVFQNHIIELFKAMCKQQYTKNHSIPINQVNIWKFLLHLWLQSREVIVVFIRCLCRSLDTRHSCCNNNMSQSW